MESNINFWETYVEDIISDMVSGKKWYSFTMASIRTFIELGLGVEYVGQYLLTNGHTHLVLNSSGDCQKVIGQCTAYYASPTVEKSRFYISLAPISFHD